MTGTGYIGRQFVLDVAQIPSLRPTSLPNTINIRSPKVWIRTITSTSRLRINQSPSISFGKENDDVIASHMRQRPDGSSRIGKGTTKKAAKAEAKDDYDIGQFVDRSKPKTPDVSLSPEVVVHESSSTREQPYDVATTRRPPFRPKNTPRAMGDPFGKNRVERGTSMDLKRKRTETVKKSTPTNSQPPLARKVTEDADTWATQKNALREKFKEGWNPRKKLSPDAQEGIRNLHEQDPITYSTEVLAQQFKQSPEAIRRILKSKWRSQQSPEKVQELRERWARRHDRIWDAKAEIGQRPPRRKDKEVEDPDHFEQELERRRVLGEI